uniref:TRAF interacting protein n=1 Tax=Pipistrellus kuhlii TaxID=59472 RepID=A0A7J7WF18_PIPKU|nr:TRAF interacting protein [Pipistrellus kuhlii]
MLQETLSLPPGDSEAVNRLVLESPAPVEMLSLKLRRPAFSDDIDLNATFDVDTPPARPPGLQRGPAKKLCLEKARAPTQDGPGKLPKGSTQEPQLSLGGQRCAGEPDEELAGAFPLFIRNAVLGPRQPKRAQPEPRRSTDTVSASPGQAGPRAAASAQLSLSCRSEPASTASGAGPSSSSLPTRL